MYCFTEKKKFKINRLYAGEIAIIFFLLALANRLFRSKNKFKQFNENCFYIKGTIFNIP